MSTILPAPSNPAPSDGPRRRSTTRPPLAPEELARQRWQVADFCRYLLANRAEQKGFEKRTLAVGLLAAIAALTPRVRQTLDGLLAGEGEKQIARQLGVSRHTVHVYVKTLYRHFDVCTRGELLSRFVTR